jgi:Mrp family chromosome partitioning ATPase
MSKTCSDSCTSCTEECSERKEKPDLREQPHELSRIGKVFAVVSGKGGVGKSLVTSMLAVTMRRLGYKTAILDADITGPSIPKVFGLTEKASGDALGMYPVTSRTGIDVMSVNLLLPDETDPVVWRGPVIAGSVKQFWTDVIWSDIDIMFIDMPPGTGDVPLTVFQSLPVDGIIVVTSPQELVSMIVSKAVKMAEMMHIPVIGLVENMSYFKCPDNGRNYQIFGDSHIDTIAEKHGLTVLARVPIDPGITALCDSGTIEQFEGGWLDGAADIIDKSIKNKE